MGMKRLYTAGLIFALILFSFLSACSGYTASQSAPSGAETSVTATQTIQPTATTGQTGPILYITNSAGSALAQARVCIINPLTLQTQTMWSGQDGYAALSALSGGTVLVTCSLPGYTTENLVLTGDDGNPIPIALNEQPSYAPWLLAFTTRTQDGQGRIYLAQSADGIAWELLEKEPLYEAPLPSDKSGGNTYKTEAYEALVVTMSPDVILADGLPRVYFDQYFLYPDQAGGWTRKTINQNPGNWNPEMKMIALDTFGFFDHQVSVLHRDSALLLLGKNRLGYGYSELGITMGVGGAVDDAVFGYTVEADGGMRQVFNCPENRYLLKLDGQYELREPDWIQTSSGSYMIATASDGLRVFRAEELTGPYDQTSHLLYAAQGLAGSCVDYDPVSKSFTVFISYLNEQKILRAQVPSLSDSLRDEDFTVILDAYLLPEEQQAITFLGNPGTCVGIVELSPLNEPSGPFQLSLASPRNRSFTIGMGSTGYSQSGDDQEIHVSMVCGAENQGNNAGLLPVSLLSDFACSVQVTLPDHPDAMGGLAYCWQDEGEYMGGYCFRVGKDRWELIHVKPSRYFTGTYLVPIVEEQITLIASGALDEPFTQGRLSVILSGGTHFLFRDGKLIGQAVMRSLAVTEHLTAEPLLTGYPGIYVRALQEKMSVDFSDFLLVDLNGQYRSEP